MHWVLMVASKETRTLEVYDSSIKYRRATHARLGSQFAGYLEILGQQESNDWFRGLSWY